MDKTAVIVGSDSNPVFIVGTVEGQDNVFNNFEDAVNKYFDMIKNGYERVYLRIGIGTENNIFLGKEFRVTILSNNMVLMDGYVRSIHDSGRGLLIDMECRGGD